MNFILRNFVYGIGLTTMYLASKLSPETAQFRDLVTIFHAPPFWIIAGCVAAMLAALDLILAGRLVIPVSKVAAAMRGERRHVG